MEVRQASFAYTHPVVLLASCQEGPLNGLHPLALEGALKERCIASWQSMTHFCSTQVLPLIIIVDSLTLSTYFYWANCMLGIPGSIPEHIVIVLHIVHGEELVDLLHNFLVIDVAGGPLKPAGHTPLLMPQAPGSIGELHLQTILGSTGWVETVLRIIEEY